MIILITGASHTGKTALAQMFLERYQYPYLSIDHLKMGLIRSGNTALTPTSDDAALTGYLWPIVREIVKTNLENDQNLIVEGCYVPLDWAKEFDEEALCRIRFYCLLMSDRYMETHFAEIRKYANVIECRQDDDWTLETARAENAKVREGCARHGIRPILIEDDWSTAVAGCLDGCTPAPDEKF